QHHNLDAVLGPQFRLGRLQSFEEAARQGIALLGPVQGEISDTGLHLQQQIGAGHGGTLIMRMSSCRSHYSEAAKTGPRAIDGEPRRRVRTCPWKASRAASARWNSASAPGSGASFSRAESASFTSKRSRSSRSALSSSLPASQLAMASST